MSLYGEHQSVLLTSGFSYTVGVDGITGIRAVVFEGGRLEAVLITRDDFSEGSSIIPAHAILELWSRRAE